VVVVVAVAVAVENDRAPAQGHELSFGWVRQTTTKLAPRTGDRQGAYPR